jgi:tetratricopeptide (TPR) repeat protein
MSRTRTPGVRVILLACVLSAVTVAVLHQLGVKGWLTQASLAVAAAVATFLGIVFRDQLTDAMKRRAEFKYELTKATLTVDGQLPQVKDMADPISLGVHPASLRESGQEAGVARGDRVPAYIERDIDPELRQALGSSGFVVVTGEATAGKTRTAFEAMRTVLSDHLFIAPTDCNHMAAAVEQAKNERHCVLWLDDIEAYLALCGRLVRKAIVELLAGPNHHRVVLATLSATDESRLTDVTQDNGQLIRVSQAVLDQADRRVEVARIFSANERARGRRLADTDPRLADALSHAEKYGIGEYLACGPQLFREWERAWARGNRPRGAALISAAVDCRRAGFTAELPKALLTELHTFYLDRKGGSDRHPELLDEAWEWVTRLRVSGSAPLNLARPDHYELFDYFVGEVTRRHGVSDPVPEQTARAALTYAGAADASNIAAAAWYHGQHALAEEAINKAFAAFSEKYGPGDPDTLLTRHNLAVVQHALARITDAQAEAQYRAVFQGCQNALGRDHPATLASRNNLAVVLHAQGRLADAEAEHRAVLLARRDALGPDHPATLISQHNLAVVLGDLNRLAAAEAEYRAVLKARIRVLGPEHPHTAISRNNLASLLKKRSSQ